MKASKNTFFIIMSEFYLVNMEGSKLTYLEYQVQLVLNGRTREKRTSGGHFVENAAHAPHINGGGVLGGAQQHVRRPVPEGHHLVAVRLRRHALGSRKAKVRKLKYGKCVVWELYFGRGVICDNINLLCFQYFSEILNIIGTIVLTIVSELG